jgi:RNA polymerase sigma factor (sigma-70 family)
MITCHRHSKRWARRRNTAATAPANGIADDCKALLVAVAERRDHSAFARLFDRFATRIETYLRRLGAERALAEDLTQEVMLVIWQQAWRYDPTRAAASTWIFTIARNRLIDALRRQRSEQKPDGDAIEVLAGDDTEQSFYLTQLQRYLRHAVTLLPSEQNQLIEQGYFRDKTQATLADELDLPLGTVKSRQRLALGRLRRHLEPLR